MAVSARDLFACHGPGLCGSFVRFYPVSDRVALPDVAHECKDPPARIDSRMRSKMFELQGCCTDARGTILDTSIQGPC